MRDFRKLNVWHEAHSLTLEVYKASKIFPKDETYGLTSQMRRAWSSIPANIAEGCGREGEAEFKRFLQIAQGSASELEYHLLLARDLGFLNDENFESLNKHTGQIGRMLTTLLKKLKYG